MSFFKGMFGGGRTYKQSDNRGTYHNNIDIASAYWVQRNVKQKFEPFLLYKFKDEADAVRSLLDIECIRIAEDTEELICTEVLIYGYYPVEGNEFEAVLCGEEMSHHLFVNAKKAFIKNNGIKLNELEPAKDTQSPAKSKTKQISVQNEVKFLKETKQIKMGHTFTYRIYKGQTASSAVSFLEKNPVTENLLYIIVETPEGNYGRDIQGIYKE